MKTLTMSEFRSEPGEHLIDVRRQGQSIVLTKGGKPIARVLPFDDMIVINSDGTVIGEPLPLGDVRRGGSY